MIGTIDLENMEPAERVSALMDYYNNPGDITIDKVRFVADLPKTEATSLAHRLLGNCSANMSGNARAFLYRASGQYKGKEGPTRPYSYE